MHKESPSEADLIVENRPNIDFLDGLNASLAPFEETLYLELEEEYPTIQIVGSPRSGTTLLIQCLASGLQLGYISNLAAAFWRAPLCGVRIARQSENEYRPSSFYSEYGRTFGAHEPHEFGYFWKEHLLNPGMLEPQHAVDEQIDWQRLRTIIVNLTHEFRAPLLFKCFLLQWYLKPFINVLPLTCCIRIRRDPIESAVSLLGMRKHYYGDYRQWTSLKPRQYEDLAKLTCWEQVAGQVFYLNKSMEEDLQAVPVNRVLNIDLTDLRKNPTAIVDRVFSFLESIDVTVPKITSKSFPRFNERNSDHSPGDYRKVEAAYHALLDNEG